MFLFLFIIQFFILPFIGKDLSSIGNNINNPIHILGFGEEIAKNEISIKDVKYPYFHLKSDLFIIEYTIYSN